MSFDVWVQWFEGGEQMWIPVPSIAATFGDAITNQELTRLIIRYGPSDDTEVLLAPDEDDRVTGLTIHRPCGALALWDAIAQLLQSRHAVCFWPGSMPIIGVTDAAAHIPADMYTSLGTPRVVASGAELRALVTRQ